MTVIVRASGRQTVRCPYCLDALDLQPATACPACRTALHDECRAAARGCTTLGCAGAPRVGGRPATAPPTHRLREPPLWPWIGRGWLRSALAYLIAVPVVVLALVATLLVGAAAAAAADNGLFAVGGLFMSLVVASAAGHETVAWFKGES